MWVLTGITYVGHLEQYQHFESTLIVVADVDGDDVDYSIVPLMMVKSLSLFPISWAPDLYIQLY